MHTPRVLLYAALALAALVGCDGRAVVGGNVSRDASVDSALDAPAACPSPLRACIGRCIDPRSDRDNCGACGRSCGTGNVCQNGACVPDCTADETLCAGASSGDGGAALRCVSLQTDLANCGACGNACGQNQVCSNGMCVFMCGAGTTECTRTTSDLDAGTSTTRYCADLTADRANCGACGNTCQEGYACSDGRCRLRCPELQIACGVSGADAGPMGGGEACVGG